MKTYTVAFFGHRHIDNHFFVEQRIFEIVCDLIRNRYMVDRADLIMCFIERNQGGAYNTIKYAEKMNKKIVHIK